MSFPIVEISRVANFINGFAFKPNDWEDSGLPIIRIQNLTDPTKPYNFTTKEVPEKYLVRKGDILVSWSATIDVFEWERDNAILNQHIFKVEFDQEKVDKDYFKKALKKTIFDLSRYAHGSTMKHVVKKDFESHKIPLPPLDDQKRIAYLLSKVEGLIAQRKQHLQHLDDLLKSVFLEMFGDPVRNEKGWETNVLEGFCEKIVDCPHSTPIYSDEKTGFFCVRSGDIINGYLDLSSTFQVDLSVYKERIKRYTPQKGDILYSREGGRLGNAARILGDAKICLGQRIMLLNVNARSKPDFLWALLESASFKSKLQGLVGGGAAPRVNIKDLKKIELIQPPLNSQTVFSNITQKVDKIKTRYQASLTDLENL